MAARVSVLSMNRTHALPKRLGSDVPGYCGVDTKDRLPLGLLTYELALKMSKCCKLHEPNVVL